MSTPFTYVLSTFLNMFHCVIQSSSRPALLSLQVVVGGGSFTKDY